MMYDLGSDSDYAWTGSSLRSALFSGTIVHRVSIFQSQLMVKICIHILLRYLKQGVKTQEYVLISDSQLEVKHTETKMQKDPEAGEEVQTI